MVSSLISDVLWFRWALLLVVQALACRGRNNGRQPLRPGFVRRSTGISSLCAPSWYDPRALACHCTRSQEECTHTERSAECLCRSLWDEFCGTWLNCTQYNNSASRGQYTALWRGGRKPCPIMCPCGVLVSDKALGKEDMQKRPSRRTIRTYQLMIVQAQSRSIVGRMGFSARTRGRLHGVEPGISGPIARRSVAQTESGRST